MLDFDLDAAVRHNSKVLGLAQQADNTEARIAIALAHWQESHGLEPDGAYDRATEESLNTARYDYYSTPDFVIRFSTATSRAPSGMTGDPVQ